MLHHITLSHYGIGVCVTAIGLWLYLKWTDQDLSEAQWVLFILAIVAWPLVLFALPYRFLMWVKFRYEMSKDYRSPDRR